MNNLENFYFKANYLEILPNNIESLKGKMQTIYNTKGVFSFNSEDKIEAGYKIPSMFQDFCCSNKNRAFVEHMIVEFESLYSSN